MHAEHSPAFVVKFVVKIFSYREGSSATPVEPGPMAYNIAYNVVSKAGSCRKESQNLPPVKKK